MNREGLMKIAEEVNTNLKPTNPIKINTKSTFETLIGGIKEIVETFEGKAALSKSTIDFLCEKEVDVPANITILEKKKAKSKSNKEKTEIQNRDKIDKYGFRPKSASSRAAELIMSGQDRKHSIAILEKEFNKDSRVAEGRIAIIERELKKRGFLK